MTVKKCLVTIALGLIAISNPVFDLSAANIPHTTPAASSKPYRLLAILPALPADVQLNPRPVPELNPELIGALLLGFVGWNERKRLLALVR
jgi:hypothetical protein